MEVTVMAANSNNGGRFGGSTLSSLSRALCGSVFALALVAVPMAGTSKADDHGVHKGPIPVDHVTRAPEAYYGQRISVKGDIDDVYGPGVFTIEKDSGIQDSTRFAGPDLLVIVPMSVRSTLPAAEIKKGKDIVLVGVLHHGRIPDMDDVKDFQGDVDFDNKPVLLVEEVHFD
jgi:hypothetical protein